MVGSLLLPSEGFRTLSWACRSCSASWMVLSSFFNWARLGWKLKLAAYFGYKDRSVGGALVFNWFEGHEMLPMTCTSTYYACNMTNSPPNTSTVCLKPFPTATELCLHNVGQTFKPLKQQRQGQQKVTLNKKLIAEYKPHYIELLDSTASSDSSVLHLQCY